MHEKNIQVILFMLNVQTFFLKCQQCPGPVYPEQIHLSLGESGQEMVVTWITFEWTDSFVWYGTLAQGLQLRSKGVSKKFIDEGPAKTVRYIHRVLLSNLQPHTFYVYRCGDSRGVSSPYVFKVTPKGTNWSPRILIFGDMGVTGGAILPYVQNQSRTYQVDAIVHVGDIAYNMDSSNGAVGDDFLRMIQPIASCIPYMTAVGNHEQAYNFSHYKNRFSMPGNSEGLFYSFNLGPVHFVTVSTEVYYFTNYGYEPLINQYNWLRKDLKKATKTKNREHRPWIIVFSHRPLYCSSDTGEDCSHYNNALKCYCIGSCNCGLEKIFQRNKVDLIFSGHMHYYERSWPIYNNRVYNGSYREPYRNPGASVHIITGAAGMQYGTEKASYIQPEWFAFYSKDYSYTLLTICNKTHLYLEQISVNRGGEVIDSMWLVKDGRRNEN